MKDKNLVYSLIYMPSISSDKTINYLCSDNKVHIRLKKYGIKPEIISGFENKLSFLLTFSLNEFCNHFYMSKDLLRHVNENKNFKDIWLDIMKEFKTKYNSFGIDDCLSNNILYYEGLKILPIYYKKFKLTNALDLIGECYNLKNKLFDDNPTKNFLDYFKLSSLDEYLFNDAIVIQISKKLKINNSKFINKSKHKIQHYESKLW